MVRFPSRWAGGDPRKARVALFALLCLRGTPVLYQGDEIGQCDALLSKDDLKDPLGVMYWPYAGRDAARTPMPWRDGPGGGFTDPGVRPWLPLGDTSSCNVEQQRSEGGSILMLCRDLIALRRSFPELQTGGHESMNAPDGVWAFKRAGRFLVALNMSDRAAAIDGVTGTICISTDRRREGEASAGHLEVSGWEGLIVDLASG